jgi:hypothetical protein
MKVTRPWWQNLGIQIAVPLVVLVLLSAGVNIVLLTQRSPEQPIAFPHNLHVGLGMQCLYCHPGGQWGASSGLPSTDKCWGCHQQINRQTPELDKLASFAKDKKSIPWVPVAIQPDFVHFNHRPHIAAGLNCESCHGEVGKMKVAEFQPRQNMGWCLDCHKRMRPENFQRLSDCSTCHY